MRVNSHSAFWLCSLVVVESARLHTCSYSSTFEYQELYVQDNKVLAFHVVG